MDGCGGMDGRRDVSVCVDGVRKAVYGLRIGFVWVFVYVCMVAFGRVW